VQNVVTYTAVINVDNRDMALLPGMTANLQIITDQRNGVLRAPNAALRFRPVVNAATVSAPTGAAQEDNPFGAPGAGAGGQRAAQALRERIIADVRPTPEQLATIDAILAEGRERLRAERQGASPEEIRRNAQMVRRENGRRIAEALDPERRTKFQASMATFQQQGRRADARETTPGRIHVLGEDGQPRAIDVRLGITDGAVTEVIAADLQPGLQVITGGGPPRTAQPAGPPTRGPRLF
jgi:HlyD family secretion protein